jgi:hypothetical protein
LQRPIDRIARAQTTVRPPKPQRESHKPENRANSHGFRRNLASPFPNVGGSPESQPITRAGRASSTSLAAVIASTPAFTSSAGSLARPRRLGPTKPGQTQSRPPMAHRYPGSGRSLRNTFRSTARRASCLDGHAATRKGYDPRTDRLQLAARILTLKELRLAYYQFNRPRHKKKRPRPVFWGRGLGTPEFETPDIAVNRNECGPCDCEAFRLHRRRLFPSLNA